ncbi:MAG: hypothetical protein U0840_22420 [Gemmataceae bacterium]
MSTAPPNPEFPAPQPLASPPPPAPQQVDEVTIVSHSTLFYWWPVWAVAFLMAALTYLDGYLMAVLPPKTVSEVVNGRDTIILPEGKHLPRVGGESSKTIDEPHLRIARSPRYGVVFCTVLLLVILITNVPLRGMWSVVVIITIILLSVIFALAGWWEPIFEKLGRLDIRINAGGYIFLGVTLFALWLFTLMFFDRQVYIVFNPSQFKVCTEIGGGEKVYSTVGLQLERQKGDLFRHYILGLGSGDLIVRTTGAQSHHFDFPNVLFISKKMQMIEQLLQTVKVDVKG